MCRVWSWCVRGASLFSLGGAFRSFAVCVCVCVCVCVRRALCAVGVRGGAGRCGAGRFLVFSYFRGNGARQRAAIFLGSASASAGGVCGVCVCVSVRVCVWGGGGGAFLRACCLRAALIGRGAHGRWMEAATTDRRTEAR